MVKSIDMLSLEVDIRKRLQAGQEEGAECVLGIRQIHVPKCTRTEQVICAAELLQTCDGCSSALDNAMREKVAPSD